MSEKIDLMRGWLAKAESDLLAGQRLLAGGPYDIVCFHAQQAIEKLLKALLVSYNLPLPRTHDLEELQRLLLATRQHDELAELDLFEASDYAVMARYDLQFWPDEATATEALALAGEVKRLVYIILATETPDQGDESALVG